MNAPKFKLGDNVVFSREINGKQYVVKGSVYTVDKCGTFEQDEEPSYDIMSVGLDGQERLYIHIRESHCLRCYRFTGNSILEIHENTPKFKIGDKVRISPDLDRYYKRGMNAQHWTLSVNSVTIDMLQYADCVSTIEADDVSGYTLDVVDGFSWPSELLTLVEDEKKIPEPVDLAKYGKKIPEPVEDETSNSDFQIKLRARIENIIGKISDRRFAFILEVNKDILNTARQLDEVEVELIDMDDVDGMNLADLVEKLKTTNANLPGCTIRIEKGSIFATMRIMAQVEESDEAFIDRILRDFDLTNESYVDYLEKQLDGETAGIVYSKPIGNLKRS